MLAVGGLDGFFCVCFSEAVEAFLHGGPEDRHVLRAIDQVGVIVIDDARRRRIDEGFDCADRRGAVQEVVGSCDDNIVVGGFGGVRELGGCGMEDCHGASKLHNA